MADNTSVSAFEAIKHCRNPTGGESQLASEIGGGQPSKPRENLEGSQISAVEAENVGGDLIHPVHRHGKTTQRRRDLGHHLNSGFVSCHSDD